MGRRFDKGSRTGALSIGYPRYKSRYAAKPRILIDDLANYPRLEDIEREQAEKEQSGIYDLKSNEGLITRLLRSSAGPFGRKKKWFR